MATLPAPDAPIADLTADKVGDIILIEVSQTKLGDRLRPIDPIWAAALGLVMAREGQNKPVEVCRLPGEREWTIVDGGHRWTGARMEGIVYLRAEVVGADRDARERREIDAQLWHRGLDDPIDRATFMAKLVSLKRARAGVDVADHRTASVATRWKRALDDEADQTVETISTVYGFSNELGAELGLTGRTVRNDLLLYRRLKPSNAAKLRQAGHPIARNATQLRKLATLDSAEQDLAIAYLLRENDPAKTVAAAIAQMRGSNRPSDPEAKRLSTFIGTFARMSVAEKKGALVQLAGMLPAGFRLTGEQGA